MTVLTHETTEFLDEETLDLTASAPPELDAWTGGDAWFETNQRLEPLWER